MAAPRRTLHAGMLRPVRWPVLLAMLAMLGCSGRAADAPAGPPVARAFYYWRTTFALSAAETRALTALGVTRLYVRMFDVAWSEAEHRASPVGPLAVATGAHVPAGVE